MIVIQEIVVVDVQISGACKVCNTKINSIYKLHIEGYITVEYTPL